MVNSHARRAWPWGSEVTDSRTHERGRVDVSPFRQPSLAIRFKIAASAEASDRGRFDAEQAACRTRFRVGSRLSTLLSLVTGGFDRHAHCVSPRANLDRAANTDKAVCIGNSVHRAGRTRDSCAINAVDPAACTRSPQFYRRCAEAVGSHVITLVWRRLSDAASPRVAPNAVSRKLP